MDKLENYIYLSICEYTLVRFKLTHYATFANFCSQLKYWVSSDMKDKNVGHLLYVVEKIRLIYGFDDVECLGWLYKFYSLQPESIAKYQAYIAQEKAVYPWLVS